MKNCPWFSLRSNSIESRFRSILGAIFSQYSHELEKKQKQLGIRSAHKLFTRCARSRLNFLHVIYAYLGFTA